MRKLKILHVLHSFNIGGLENGVVNLINYSNPDLFEHEICRLTGVGEAQFRLTRPVNIYNMQKREGNDWQLVLRLAKLMKERRPDIVHTRNWGTVDGIAAAKLAGVPVVIHGEHGWNMDDPQGQNRKRNLARKVLSAAVDHFVAVSQDIKNWLVNSIGIKADKVKKIINGVDTEKFCPAEKGKISDRGVIIGTVGRLDPIKDQALLMQAFARLNREHNNLKLVFVGDGPEHNNLEMLRQTLPCANNVQFLGNRNDVDVILKTFDLFVLPSRNEGISNTILEAMAIGIPVIATNVGGNPELVQDGQTGSLVPSGNCDALASAINSYIRNPELACLHGQYARERAVREFSLNRMIEEYENLYLKALDTGASK